MKQDIYPTISCSRRGLEKVEQETETCILHYIVNKALRYTISEAIFRLYPYDIVYSVLYPELYPWYILGYTTEYTRNTPGERRHRGIHQGYTKEHISWMEKNVFWDRKKR